jgi:hypothetical protein
MSIFSVSLDLSSDTLTLEQLTSYAGAQPTRSGAKGERISLRLPATKVRINSFWNKDSGVVLDSWTLDPHWPVLAPILESIASKERTDEIEVTLSIGTNARGSGFAFDMAPEHVALLARARCGVWIDSYGANRDREDLPDDYPYPEGGTIHRAGAIKRLRRRLNVELRNAYPFGKVRRHRRKLVARPRFPNNAGSAM